MITREKYNERLQAEAIASNATMYYRKLPRRKNQSWQAFEVRNGLERVHGTRQVEKDIIEVVSLFCADRFVKNGGFCEK